MALLRKIEHCVNGVQPAWEETFRNWYIKNIFLYYRNDQSNIPFYFIIFRDSMCKLLQSYPKGPTGKGGEECPLESLPRTTGKRRASHQSSEHDLEVIMLFSVSFICIFAALF